MESSTACPVCTLYLREGISLYDHLDTHPKDQVIEALIRIRERDESLPASPPQPLLPIPTSQSAPYYQSPQPCFPVQQFPANNYTYQPMTMMGTSSISSHMAPVAMVMPPSNPNPSLMQVMYNPYILPQQNIHVLSPDEGPTPSTSPVAQDSAPTTPKVSTTSHEPSQSVSSNPSSDSTPFHLHTPTPESRKRQSPPPPHGGFVPPLPPVVRPAASYNEAHAEFHSDEVQEVAAQPSHTEEAPRSPPRRVADGFVHADPIRRVRFVQYKLSSERIARSSKETETCVVQTEKDWTVNPHFAPASSSGLSKLVAKPTPSGTPPASSSARNKRARIRSSRSPRSKASVVEPALSNNADYYTSQPGSSRLEPMAALDVPDCRPALKADRSEDNVTAEPALEVDPLLSQEQDFEPANPKLSQRSGSPTFRRLPDVEDPTFRRLAVDKSDDPACRRLVAHKSIDPGFRKVSVHESEEPRFRRVSVHESDEPGFRKLSVHEPDNSGFRKHAVHEPNESGFRRLSVHEPEDPGFQGVPVLESEGPGLRRLAVLGADKHRFREVAVHESDSPGFQGQKVLESKEPGFRRLSIHESEDPGFRKVSVLESEDPGYRRLSVRDSEDHGFRELSVQGSDEPGFREVSVLESEDPGYRRLSVHNSEDHRFRELSVQESNEPGYRIDPEEAEFRKLSAAETEDPLEVRTAVDSIVMPEDEYITSDCLFEARVGAEVGHEPPGEEYDTPFVGEIMAGEFRAPRPVEVMTYTESSQGSEAYPVLHTMEAPIKPKVLKQQIDDLNVSTSYDVLAREGWAVSDGSDTESAAPRAGAPWAGAVPRSDPAWTASTAAAKRPYKCALCGETFNCPKERRVHRTAYHSAARTKVAADEAPPPEPLVEQPMPLKTERVRTPRATKKKRVVKAVKVLVVQSDSDKFTGVFVKEDEEAMDTDDIKKEAAVTTEPHVAGGSVAKRFVKMPATRKRPKGGPYQCKPCSLQFVQHKKYILHMDKEHKSTTVSIKNPYICSVCQEVFTNDRRYSEHLQIHPLECKTCCKTFFRRQNLVLHMRRHLGIKPYACNMCTKTFITKQKLNEHKNVHLGLTPIKCTLCSMAFRRYSNLIQHKNRFHYMIKKKVKDYVCFCGDIFHSKKKLEWHKEIHEKKPKCCKFCSERFVHTASLTRHIRRAHDRRYMPKVGRETENVECAVCGHVFLKSSLMVHMRLHTGERPYSCSVCGKTFTTKWNLQQHRWTHMSRSSKPFKCNQCKSAFARESDYSQHMDSHSNKRPYTCNVCGLQFVRKNNCIRHAKEHQATKTFQCKVCNKSFHRGYYLKDHMMVHSGQRPFTCHICGKASSTKSNHNKHVKIHHAREPVNTEA